MTPEAIMARQTTLQYEFRPPRWRPPEQINYRTGVLAMGSFVWLLAYATLGMRLMARRRPSLGWAELLLMLVSIVLGVALVVGWRAIAQRWVRRLHGELQPALDRRALYALTPSEFEQYVAQRLFARHGYRVINTPDSHDGGVDIVVMDQDGRRAIVQCKRYKGTVGAPAVRDLYGTMIHSDADMAYLVATGGISAEAYAWAAGKPIVLIDGDRLVDLSRSDPEVTPTTFS